MRFTFLPLLIFLLPWSLQLEAETKGQEGKTEEEQLRLQIYLDQLKFGPGKLDGHQGEFTGKALSRAAQAKSVSEESLKNEARSSAQLWTEYTIKASDFDYVGRLPEKPEEMAKLKFLPYATLGELIAERYHTDLDYLKKLNEGKDIEKLEAGTVVKVPAVEPFVIETAFPDPKAPKTEQIKEKKPNENKGEESAVTEPGKAGRHIGIHRAEHILELWENGVLLASFPVSVGPPDNETPAGEHSVKNITWRPTFRHDKKMLKEGVRGDEAHLLPPGPNNPVGVVWIQTSKDGIGIHGTNDPDLIGRNVSSGCIRLSNWDAAALAGMIEPGCKIVID